MRLLTIAETAAVLGVAVKTVRRRLDDGALKAFRDGRVVRIHPADLAAYIDARRRA